MMEELLNILKENNNDYLEVSSILEGMNVCRFFDKSCELVKLLDKVKNNTNDYKIKLLCIKIIVYNMGELLSNYADTWDIDICDEEVEAVSVNYRKLKIEKTYCYNLFDEYIDILKYYFDNDESDYEFPCSMNLESGELVNSISDFSFLGIKYDYMCRKFIYVLGEEEAYKKVSYTMCHLCNNKGCSISIKYERYNKLKFRMEIIGAFVSITNAKFGQSLDYIGMSFLGSSYNRALCDTYDFLTYSEIGLKSRVITEKESSLIRQVYELDKQLCENKISQSELEIQYKKLYNDFFYEKDIFSVIYELPF